VRRAAVQWVRNVPQRDGGADDGRTVGRSAGAVRRVSGKDKALSNGVQSDTIDAGAASGGAQAQRRGMPKPALHLTAAASRRFVAFRLTRPCGRGC
jgi:hypothetical protein